MTAHYCSAHAILPLVIFRRFTTFRHVEVILYVLSSSFKVLARNIMRHIHGTAPRHLSILLAIVFALLLAIPLCAYDFPLTESSIRDAYFLGARQGGLGPDFLAEYTRTIPKLSVGDFKSTLTIETPFTQVAVYASRKLNYSAQDAVKDFSDKPLVFRIHMDIIYMVDAPPDAIEFKLIQNKKELIPDSVERSSYFPASDPYTSPPAIGETLTIEFKAEKIDSSTLSILIDTPDDQHAELELDLRTLR